jgi:hypothetical protein
MIKAVFSIIVLIMAFVMPVAGQSASFLSFPTDARMAGLGNAGYVLASPLATQHNMAAIMTDDASTNAVAATYLNWQPETVSSNLFRAGGYAKVGRVGFSAGFDKQGLSAIQLTDNQGNAIGSFKPMEYSMGLGIGYTISQPLTAGVALRYVQSTMGENNKANAFAADVSLLYSRDKLKAGLGITNIGTKLNYGYADYSLPTRMQAGAAYSVLNTDLHSLVGVADLAYQLSPGFEGLIGGVGVEYGYKQLLFLRGGTHFETKSIGSSYSTVGLGVHLWQFSLDVAHLFALGQDSGRQAFVASLSWMY